MKKIIIATLVVIMGVSVIAQRRLTIYATDKTNNQIISHAIDLTEIDSIRVMNIADIHDHKGHEFVDLGLSVLWATCNIGANTPSEYGDYFAWGETTPKTMYNFETSATHKVNIADISGNAEYDAARAIWSSGWRMPTSTEVSDLVNAENCTWTWTTVDGVPGYKVTSKKAGYTGNSIFLPAGGSISYNIKQDVGLTGEYWSSTPHTNVDNQSENKWAYYILFYNNEVTSDYYRMFLYRSVGRNIRPVMTKVAAQ